MVRTSPRRLVALALLAAAPLLAGATFAPPAHADAPAAAPAAAQKWDIDSSHTTAGFAVRHMMVSNVFGQFGKTTGTVVWDGKDTTKIQIDASIDVSTVSTRDEKRDAHLKSADFFDAAKFPAITFKSKSATALVDGKFQVTGDLTIHGVTREVVLDVADVTGPVNDPWGNVRAGARATTKINRKDFGVSWNKSIDGGGIVVGDTVAITLDLELSHPAAKK